MVNQLLQQTWFKVTVGAVMVGIGGVAAWFIYRSFQTRQIHTLNAEFTDTTASALEEVKAHDAATGSNHFKALQPFLEKWHTTDDGYVNAKLRKHIDNVVKKKKITRPKLAAPAAVPAAPAPPNKEG